MSSSSDFSSRAWVLDQALLDTLDKARPPAVVGWIRGRPLASLEALLRREGISNTMSQTPAQSLAQSLADRLGRTRETWDEAVGRFFDRVGIGAALSRVHAQMQAKQQVSDQVVGQLAEAGLLSSRPSVSVVVEDAAEAKPDVLSADRLRMGAFVGSSLKRFVSFQPGTESASYLLTLFHELGHTQITRRPDPFHSSRLPDQVNQAINHWSIGPVFSSPARSMFGEIFADAYAVAVMMQGSRGTPMQNKVQKAVDQLLTVRRQVVLNERQVGRSRQAAPQVAGMLDPLQDTSTPLPPQANYLGCPLAIERVLARADDWVTMSPSELEENVRTLASETLLDMTRDPDFGPEMSKALFSKTDPMWQGLSHWLLARMLHEVEAVKAGAPVKQSLSADEDGLPAEWRSHPAFATLNKWVARICARLEPGTCRLRPVAEVASVSIPSESVPAASSALRAPPQEASNSELSPREERRRLMREALAEAHQFQKQNPDSPTREQQSIDTQATLAERVAKLDQWEGHVWMDMMVRNVINRVTEDHLDDLDRDNDNLLAKARLALGVAQRRWQDIANQPAPDLVKNQSLKVGHG